MNKANYFTFSPMTRCNPRNANFWVPRCQFGMLDERTTKHQYPLRHDYKAKWFQLLNLFSLKPSLYVESSQQTNSIPHISFSMLWAANVPELSTIQTELYIAVYLFHRSIMPWNINCDFISVMQWVIIP